MPDWIQFIGLMDFFEGNAVGIISGHSVSCTTAFSKL